MSLVDFQKLKESIDLMGIKQASDADHPGEDMDRPSVSMASDVASQWRRCGPGSGSVRRARQAVRAGRPRGPRLGTVGGHRGEARPMIITCSSGSRSSEEHPVLLSEDHLEPWDRGRSTGKAREADAAAAAALGPRMAAHQRYVRKLQERSSARYLALQALHQSSSGREGSRVQVGLSRAASRPGTAELRGVQAGGGRE